jgi:hypothetical protein
MIFTGRLQRTEITWLTRKIIAALVCYAASQVKQKREEKKEYWRTRSKTIKQEILWIKTKLTRVPDNKETAVLTLGENRANTAIQAIHSICWSDDGETKEKNQLQW